MANVPPEMKLIYDKMQWLAQKQKVATDNLSRSSVPGEGEKSIAPFKAHIAGNKSTTHASVNLTNSGHLSGSSARNAGGYKVKETSNKNEVNLAGNSISSEKSLLELNEAVTETYRLEQAHKNLAGRLKAIYSLGSK